MNRYNGADVMFLFKDGLSNLISSLFFWDKQISFYCLQQNSNTQPFSQTGRRLNSDIEPVSSKVFLDIHATTEYRFTLKRVCDIVRTHNQISFYLVNRRVFLSLSVLQLDLLCLLCIVRFVIETATLSDKTMSDKSDEIFRW